MKLFLQKNAKFSSAESSAPSPRASGRWGASFKTPIGPAAGGSPPDPPNSSPIANFWLRACTHGGGFTSFLFIADPQANWLFLVRPSLPLVADALKFLSRLLIDFTVYSLNWLVPYISNIDLGINSTGRMKIINGSVLLLGLIMLIQSTKQLRKLLKIIVKWLGVSQILCGYLKINY